MTRVISIICSRSNSKPDTLSPLLGYLARVPGVDLDDLHVVLDASSIYDGVTTGLTRSAVKIPLSSNDTVIICHDDIKVLSNLGDFERYLNITRRPNVGFIGVAGCTTLDKDPVWWNSRQKDETRGFVFQGGNDTEMFPNYFGVYGQTIAMDGCFLATTVGVLQSIGVVQPKYVTSPWDFYDIHLTLTAYLKGFTNFAVPIIVRHTSRGEMRQGWHISKQEFARHHARNLPAKLPKDKTNGFPS